MCGALDQSEGDSPGPHGRYDRRADWGCSRWNRGLAVGQVSPALFVPLAVAVTGLISGGAAHGRGPKKEALRLLAEQREREMTAADKRRGDNLMRYGWAIAASIWGVSLVGVPS
jgi:hypothetical protein